MFCEICRHKSRTHKTFRSVNISPGPRCQGCSLFAPDLKQLPLAAVSAGLTALKASEDGVDFSRIGGKVPVGKDGKQLDAAGYESVSN